MTNKEVQNITSESLRDWFKKEKWVRISSSGNIAGDCGTSKDKKNPDRCLPKAKAQSLSKAQRAATARKKKKAGSKGKTVVKNTKAATVKKENTKLAEVAAPSTVPSNIMYSLNTTKGMSGNHRYHIGTLLQALHRGSTIQDMQPEEKFYLHTVKFNSNVTIFPKVVNEDPEEGYDDDFNIRDVGETDVVIYDNGVEGLDYPEPLPDGCKTANQSPNYSIYTHSRNFKVVKVEELTTGWDGDDYNDKTNLHVRALYAACKLEYIPDVDETSKATVKKEGLWANINAKKKAGKKSSHKNSNAYKDAKKAGNALKQETANPQDGKAAPYGSGYKPIKKMKETKEAPAGHYFTKSGNLVKGKMSADAKERGARKSDPKDKQRSKVPKATQYNEEVVNTILEKCWKGYEKKGMKTMFGKSVPNCIKKEDIINLVTGIIHEMQVDEKKKKKDDRCTKRAKREYDTWPSAYASGAVVRCRRGKIWKKK